MGHDRDISDAFAAQAGSFDTAAIANADPVLDEIIRLADPRPGQHWLEAACGPGIITRRLAPLVGTVEGIDLTPAMVDRARAAAADAGLDNVSFAVGDVCDLDRPDGSSDGAVTRFSVHHLPVPGLMFAELARVVRRGGRIVVVDHVVDDDVEAVVWSQSIERLRDPSHWSGRTVDGLRRLAASTGLDLVEDHTTPVALDFADWLDRGGADAADRRRIADLLAERPGGTDMFGVVDGPGGPTLRLRLWFGVFTSPGM